MSGNYARVGLARNKLHQYRWNGGQWQPGATSILKVQDLRGSDGLVNWAVNIALETVLAGGSPADAKAAVTAARDRGTAVHEAIEALIKGEDYEPTEQTHVFWYGFAKFLYRERPTVLASEQMVINLAHGYGGTIDLIAELHGKTVQIDFKTGEPKDEHALQLAAYAGAEWMGHEDDPKKYDMPEFASHYVLALMSDAPYYELVPMAVDQDTIEHFYYLSQTYHKLRAWGTRAMPREAAA